MTNVFGAVVEKYAYGAFGESDDPDALGNPMGEYVWGCRAPYPDGE